jgi:DNA-binding NarL/FixJ family response regulator
MIRVLIVDDQALVRSGFAMILGTEDDIAVVGEAADGREALDLVERARPDVVLMDIEMPRMNGLEATKAMATRESGARVVILTTFDRDDYVFEALRAGAAGFLLKNAPPDRLVEAVRIVAGGAALLSPDVTRRVIERFAALQPVGDSTDRLALLTEREREVLTHIARGSSNAEIAAALYLGEATIKTHVSSILSKLGLRDRVQAVVFAFESGVVTPGNAVYGP